MFLTSAITRALTASRSRVASRTLNDARFSSFCSVNRPPCRTVLPKRPCVPEICSLRSLTSSATSFPDVTRPDIFYHLVDPPTPISGTLPAFAVSFLPSAPPSSESPTVIGWLPAEVAEDPSKAQGSSGLNDFVENPKFRDILHEVIADGLRERVDDIQINGAKQLKDGWMHIHDDRNIPALGRIGDPDDIIASVLVRDSEILPETYQPMPSYRLCTVDGITQLTPGLAKKLRSILVQQSASM